MDIYLKPTPTLDCDNPKIVAAAMTIAGDASSDEEKARRCFFWVRDFVSHTSDFPNPIVTCTASDVLEHRTGFCYAKSHLLVALLRAIKIPAGLCYQRLALDSDGSQFFLHGLVSVFLTQHGWYRIDPRGDKEGISSGFDPPQEILPWNPMIEGEENLDGVFPDAMECVISTLHRYERSDDVRANLPDRPLQAEQ
ncbi:MAG: transglutaminase family protein [Verrucomicrobiae bacterium]|nr:transglutaminase family protein [Verrucomicrobiae bacterium]